VNEQLQRRFEDLERARREIMARIAEHDWARLNRPRADGGWSVLQVLHHVIAAEDGTRRYISKKMRAGASLPPAGLMSRARLFALQLANTSPLRLRAPGATADVPAAIDPDELGARWNEVRGDWRELLNGFPEELLDRMVFRHGMVGLMGLPDTLLFLRSHLAHHVRQLERLLGPD
jgi:hypothetical protein